MIAVQLKESLLQNLGGRVQIVRVHDAHCSGCKKIETEILSHTRLPIMYSTIEYLDEILNNSVYEYKTKNNVVRIQLTVSDSDFLCSRCTRKIAKARYQK